MTNKSKSGFTLVEVLIYTVIFAVSSIFLVSILTAITQIQNRQSSINEVNQQISFVSNAIQRSVKDASLIDMEAGMATTTLTLRMASSTLDPTIIYVDASSTAIYIQEGSNTAVALTDSNVKVNNFLVTKYENPGGPAVVQIDLALDFNTNNIQFQATRSLKTAITKISAASFDSNILPNTGDSYDIGNSSLNWRDGYFSGSIGVGISPVSGAKIKSTGDISFTTSSAGLILVAPSGSCYRLTINSSLQLATSSVACP